MAYKSKKASATIRQLKDNLSARLGSGFTVSESVESDSLPSLTITDGTWAANEDACFIKVGPETDVVQTVNAVGGTQDQFTPHIVYLVLEASAASADRAGPTVAFVSRILSHVMVLGMKVKVYHSANTNQPDNTDISAGNLKVTIDDLWNPLTSTL